MRRGGAGRSVRGAAAQVFISTRRSKKSSGRTTASKLRHVQHRIYQLLDKLHSVLVKAGRQRSDSILESLKLDENTNKIHLKLDPRIFLMQASFLKFLDSLRAAVDKNGVLVRGADEDYSVAASQSQRQRVQRQHAPVAGAFPSWLNLGAAAAESGRISKVTEILKRSVTGYYTDSGDFVFALEEILTRQPPKMEDRDRMLRRPKKIRKSAHSYVSHLIYTVFKQDIIGTKAVVDPLSTESSIRRRMLKKLGQLRDHKGCAFLDSYSKHFVPAKLRSRQLRKYEVVLSLHAIERSRSTRG
eukprot:GSA120T00019312001.1